MATPRRPGGKMRGGSRRTPREIQNDPGRSEEDSRAPSPGSEGALGQLADELYRERVLAARAMAPEDKLLAGEELFEYACSITLAGIRAQFPEASEAECRRMLEARLALRERMERSP